MSPINEQQETLIVRYLLGELDKKAETAFLRWLRESDEHQVFFQEQKKVWEAMATLEKMKSIDEEKAFQKVSHRLFSRRNLLFNRLQRAAAVLFLPLLMITCWLLLRDPDSSPLNGTVWQTAEAPPGIRSSLVLPDGTKVWLNSGTRIRYPLQPGKKRLVSIAGEAYFEVSKNPDSPFILEAGPVSVSVTGTSFNCYAYPEEEVIRTVLVEGAVSIGTRFQDPVGLKPGEQAEYCLKTQTINISQTDPARHIAWKTGKLVFRDDPMRVVVAKMERWYNVDIRIMDPEIETYTYTATFENEPLEQILRFLEMSAPIRYTMKERRILPDGTFERQEIQFSTGSSNRQQ